MSSGFAITVYLAAAFVACIVGTAVARVKRRDAGFWMVVCFLLPPLLIVLLLLPKRPFVPAPAPRHEDSDNLDEF